MNDFDESPVGQKDRRRLVGSTLHRRERERELFFQQPKKNLNLNRQPRRSLFFFEETR